MEKIKKFLGRKDVVPSMQRYGIDALGAMAQGLFCTLLVGTILNTIGQQFAIGFLNRIIVTIGTGEGAVGYTIGGNHTVGIPVYATAKDLAKEFLKFMLSDEGYRIYFDATTGNQLPIKYDLQNDTERWGSMSAFAKSRYEVTIANPEYENLITTYGTTPLTTLGLGGYALGG